MIQILFMGAFASFALLGALALPKNWLRSKSFGTFALFFIFLGLTGIYFLISAGEVSPSAREATPLLEKVLDWLVAIAFPMVDWWMSENEIPQILANFVGGKLENASTYFFKLLVGGLFLVPLIAASALMSGIFFGMYSLYGSMYVFRVAKRIRLGES